MFQKILHSTILSLLSFLILISGVDFSFEKHICLSKESKSNVDFSTNCCAKNTSHSSASTELKNNKTCCTNDADDIFSTISNTDENCDDDCCIHVVTLVKGISIVQQALKKNKIQIPVFQQINYFIQPLVSYKTYFQKRIDRNFHPPNSTVSFNILYRVFRI